MLDILDYIGKQLGMVNNMGCNELYHIFYATPLCLESVTSGTRNVSYYPWTITIEIQKKRNKNHVYIAPFY